ncbi:hypothetical protein IscW_ISCW000562 [Ixodes scapularis]|uniref:Uncharacterized protein n=1 Tax=Ixodes scapularis TaxID=6945 RepID=B7P5U4_IXOSC|nr:hypothetical protein IscW_ISCW000562 [Ixodes scapularis]|eukprot:XP_002407934.1 hypothetical protein IscW_ISCW000562 [Ixodes scapularis]
MTEGGVEKITAPLTTTPSQVETMGPAPEKEQVEPAPTDPPTEVSVAPTVSEPGGGEVKSSRFRRHGEEPSVGFRGRPRCCFRLATDDDYDLSDSGEY